MEEKECLRTFKIIIVGDSGIGKSCLFLRYIDKEFSNNFCSTIGVDFKTRTVKHKDRYIKLNFWDTAGQEKFRSIVSTYFRGAHGAILVYDITSRETFNNIEQWVDEIKNKIPTKMAMILVGNKCDLENERVVSVEEGKIYAEKLGIPFIETSAKIDQGIKEAFYCLTEEIVNKEEVKFSSDKKHIGNHLIFSQGGAVYDKRGKNSQRNRINKCCNG